MCGICGVFGSGQPEAVSAMLPLIAHRGPDDEYQVSGEHYTLGARRLSIIDLESGRQPLCNEDGSAWVAQNGEIYNFPSLREELQRQGHTFKTRSDTEVLVHLYEEKGESFCRLLNGMYAIALWDDRKRKGFLYRDRPGKKPLYYTSVKGSLYFASEIKCLLAVPGFRREINFEALHHYLSYKHVPSPLSIFKGIHMLPPAHYLIYDYTAQSVTVQRYWNIRTDYFGEKDMNTLPDEEVVERIIDVLRASVKRRLISDVPVGFFLSGGLDSSLSTAIAASESGGAIKTFTLVYPEGQATEGKFEDQRFAREISQHYGTEHHEELIDFTDFCQEFPKIISHFDEPFAGVLSTYFLARLIAKHVKVALSGDAADELFGSYLSHRLAYPLHNYNLYRATGDDHYRDFAPYENNLAYLEELNAGSDWRWRHKLLVFSEKDKHNLYSDNMRDAVADFSTERHLASYFDGLASCDPLNRILEAEFQSFFPDQVLAFVDRLSMAHSLEVRTAFLDPEFIHLAFSIPGSMKRTGGEVKSILKKAALRYLPAALVYRQKEGFVLPINQWLLADMEEYVRETLSRKNLHKHGYFNDMAIDEMINGFYSGHKELANRVLNILTFQVWYELYFNSQGPL